MGVLVAVFGHIGSEGGGEVHVHVRKSGHQDSGQ